MSVRLRYRHKEVNYVGYCVRSHYYWCVTTLVQSYLMLKIIAYLEARMMYCLTFMGQGSWSNTTKVVIFAVKDYSS